ncbi:MAG: PAS domain S-box protein, partial [Armatimonadetes bacterium]|nr:PAS domain S-box protein [Akkermansiaceae bacterium]
MNESANTEFHQSDEQFRLLVESVQDYAIFMLDPEGHVMSWNTGARRIKGYEPAEIMGRHFSVFYPAEAVADGIPGHILARALSHGRSEDDGWRVRKDGSLFWANVIVTALRDSGGELRGFAKITRDLTDQREKLALKEQGRRKDLFLATLAHELRNPIAPMLPALEIIMKSPDRPDLIKNIAATLSRQVEQMVHLLDDLMDMSRITSGKIVLKKGRAILSEIIESAIESTAPLFAEAGHELTVSIPAEPIELEADSYRVC